MIGLSCQRVTPRAARRQLPQFRDYHLHVGLRAEGVPVHDLTGGSDDFRRPGIVVSVEPGTLVRRALEFITGQNISQLPVITEGDCVGHVTEGTLMARVLGNHQSGIAVTIDRSKDSFDEDDMKAGYYRPFTLHRAEAEKAHGQPKLPVEGAPAKPPAK